MFKISYKRPKDKSIYFWAALLVLLLISQVFEIFARFTSSQKILVLITGVLISILCVAAVCMIIAYPGLYPSKITMYGFIGLGSIHLLKDIILHFLSRPALTASLVIACVLRTIILGIVASGKLPPPKKAEAGVIDLSTMKITPFKVQALFNSPKYKPDGKGDASSTPDQLAFAKNEILIIEKLGSRDWWIGRRAGVSASKGTSHHLGYVPANYVQVLQKSHIDGSDEVVELIHRDQEKSIYRDSHSIIRCINSDDIKLI